MSEHSSVLCRDHNYIDSESRSISQELSLLSMWQDIINSKMCQSRKLAVKHYRTYHESPMFLAGVGDIRWATTFTCELVSIHSCAPVSNPMNCFGSTDYQTKSFPDRGK